MQHQFEQNIPIPRSKGGAAVYPFKHLKVGESVLYPCTEQLAKHRAAKAAYRCAEYNGWHVIARKLPEGVRVWRIEGKPLENNVDNV